MAQHSEGPWWTTDNGIRNRGGYIAHTNKVQRYEGQDDRYAREVAQREADKRLMSQSPSMLKLLKTVRERSVEKIKSLVESHAHPRTGLLDTEGVLAVEAEQDFLNEIDAVIAKATT